MKKIITTVFVTALAITTVFAQSGAMFEFKTSSTSGTTGIVKAAYSSLGSRTEMQMNIPRMPPGGFLRTVIIKSAKPATLYMLDEKEKTFTTSETHDPALVTCENCEVKIMGKEKIGNYNCTHATVTKAGITSDYWTTTEIEGFEAWSKTNSGNKYMGAHGEYAALAKNGAAGFIVKSISPEGKAGITTMELVKMEKKEFPASTFEVPADFKPAATPSSAAPRQ